MKPFRYVEAEDARAAITLRRPEPLGRFLAGGTTLLDLMKLEVESPDLIIDINRIALSQIEVTDRGLSVGTLATNAELAAHPLVRERYPLLSEAILSGASPQLRNMATLGGNLLQRTRCEYFRSTDQPCNKRVPASGCGAREGLHRQHAILGTSDSCFATYPGDMAVALVALDAVVQIEGPTGSRSVVLTEFHLEPGDQPSRETVLAPDELITGIVVPPLAFARGSRYLKVRDRASYELALASAAVALEIEGGRIVQARVALGGIATRPWRARKAESALQGAPASEETFARAAAAELESARPARDNAFKVELARRTLVEALRLVAEGAAQ